MLPALPWPWGRRLTAFDKPKVLLNDQMKKKLIYRIDREGGQEVHIYRLPDGIEEMTCYPWEIEDGIVLLADVYARLMEMEE